MPRLPSITYPIITVLIILGIAAIVDHFVVASLNKSMFNDAEINLQEIETSLTNQYSALKDDITFLYSTPPVSGMARASINNGVDPLDGTTSALWRNRLKHIFVSFLENNQPYYQARVLDTVGEEYIRVERHNGRVIVRDDNDLQNKSERYYFTETKALQEGHLFVSYIDLNREGGRLEIPYRPTVRLAKPIFTEDNQFFGEIVLNVDVSLMLNELDGLTGEHLHIALLDFDQHFIKHPDKAFAFSRDLSPTSRFPEVYEVLDTPGFASLGRYQNKLTGQIIWGKLDKIRVASADEGGVLYPWVFVDDEYYQQELLKRRVESLGGLMAVLVLTLVVLQYLIRKNNELASLLAVADEAKAAVDVAEDAVITVDADWHINTINRAFEQMFLLNRKEVVGQKFTDVISQFGGSEVAQNIQSSISTGFYGVEWQNTSSKGSSTWYHCKINHIESAKAKARYAIVIRDISLEKQALLAVSEANKRLESEVDERTKELRVARDKALEVSELKSNFISTVSHEMRTPLNGIVGATGLLKKENLNAKQNKLVNMAENSVDSLRRLINDVLDLSKIEAGKLELDFRPFNPEALIESIANTMSVVAGEKGLQFYIDTVGLTIRTGHSDPHRLTQVINNVLSNAIKFTSKGYIEVRAWSDVTDNNGRLFIEVTDTGTGISPDKLTKLFTPFTQADKTIATNYGGSGLGLSICRQLLSLLGGSITAQSEPGVGAQFLIELPLAQWQLKSNEGYDRLAGKRVGLVIEAAPLRDLLTKLIGACGGEVIALPESLRAADFNALDLLFVQSAAPVAETLFSVWQAQDDSRPALYVVVGANPNTIALPDGAIVINEPLHRSLFLAKVLNNCDDSVTADIEDMTDRRGVDAINLNNSPVLDLDINVLIVDDNEINRQVAAFILEPVGCRIVMAEQGEEAIQQLLDSIMPFDVILMDCNMPVMNGYDATAAIRAGQAGAQYCSIPVIAMTANALSGESDKCYRAGMNDYITKPVDAGELIKKLHNAVTASPLESDDKCVTDIVEQNAGQAAEPGAVAVWRYEEALARLAGNERLFNKLVNLFVQSAPQKIAAIDQAVEQEDREAMRFSAHALKGNCLEIGAVSLSECLAELEHHAATYSKVQIQACVERVTLQYSLTLEKLNAFIEQGAND